MEECSFRKVFEEENGSDWINTKHQGKPNFLCLWLQLSAQVMGEASRLEGWRKKAEIDGKTKGNPDPSESAATLPEIYIQKTKTKFLCVFLMMSSEREQDWFWEKPSDMSQSLRLHSVRIKPWQRSVKCLKPKRLLRRVFQYNNQQACFFPRIELCSSAQNKCPFAQSKCFSWITFGTL